ncbi:acylphosphatase [Skermanella stibiiresistens SB22]|uniref:acylphosphatase n=1 Tax=Skermanella stibiiresistens SB22 TaxID=1385369 RepID=W9H1F6_9PROT|nr:acylphosphatase [Skermanella stibiiresistens SB22]
MTGDVRAVSVIISGRVQGVWYRAWTVERARLLGLVGWVRNLEDGTVEALFAGPADQVDAMIEACREGPKHARVTDVVVQPAEHPDADGFEQR